MKKSTLATLFILLIAGSHAQLNQSNEFNITTTAEMYRTRAKNFSTAGFVCLGGGAALYAIGVAIFPKDYSFWNSTSTDNQATFAGIIGIIGIAAAITSIPMFATGGLYNHKARISMKKINAAVPKQSNSNIQSLTLGVSLGHDTHTSHNRINAF